MMSKKSEIIDMIFRLPPMDNEVAIDSLCIECLRVFNGSVNFSDEEYISQYRRTLFSSLRQIDSDHVRNGGLQTFEYFENKGLRVRWRTQSASDRRLKRKIERRAAAISWINDLKDDRDYEFLGGLIMKKLGATKLHVTPRGNEFGIDFLAITPAFSRSNIFLSADRGVRIVGQAKYYSHPVPREKIQAFNDVMNSIRSNKQELTGVLPAWFRSSPAPLIGCFVAHNGYQSGARTSAEQNGYLLFDTRGAGEVISCVGKLDHIHSAADLNRYLWTELKTIKDEV
jgi:hypothetical protein